jgi:hypothetical protein
VSAGLALSAVSILDRKNCSASTRRLGSFMTSMNWRVYCARDRYAFRQKNLQNEAMTRASVAEDCRHNTYE